MICRRLLNDLLMHDWHWYFWHLARVHMVWHPSPIRLAYSTNGHKHKQADHPHVP